jgi:LacI family transcriptional regulator
MPVTTLGKPVKLKTIADAAGVSIATVSMALANHPDVNQDTKFRIRELSRRLGYQRPRRARSARVAAQQSEGLRFGFVLLGSRLEDDTHLGNVHALTVHASARNCRLEVFALEDVSDPARLVDEVLTITADLQGVLLSGYVDRSLLQELETAGLPHVILGHAMIEQGQFNDKFAQMVSADEVQMGELATRSLVEAGHRRIAFVAERIPRGLWNDRWLRGYTLALLECKIEPDPNLVHISGEVFSGGEPAAQALLALREPPTAYIVPDIRVGASLRDALRMRGVNLPTDALVVAGHHRLLERYGLENTPWISYDFNQMAAVAIRQLRQLCVEPMPCATELIVPFAKQNLPGKKA